MSIAIDAFHPAALLLSWGVLACLGQTLSGPVLALHLGLVLLLSMVWARRPCLRLMRRIRYLLLTLLVLFICATPGEYVRPELGWLSPTREGLALAWQHGGRLVLVVSLLALLLQFLSPQALVTGLVGLLPPWACVPRERIALRLMLVLKYVEGERQRPGRSAWLEWLGWLDADQDGMTDETIQIAQPRVSWRDGVLIGLTLLWGVGVTSL